MSLAGFESVNKGGAVFEPKQTGSKKQNNLTPLVADDNSYITGYYLGSEHGLGKEKKSTLHKLKMDKVGKPECIIGEVINGEVGIWGTGVLNNIIAEKVQVGQMVAIVWKGKAQPKQAGGNPYHNWDVMVNNAVEPLSMGAPAPAPIPEGPQATTETTTAPSEAIVDDAEDDDLPF